MEITSASNLCAGTQRNGVGSTCSCPVRRVQLWLCQAARNIPAVAHAAARGGRRGGLGVGPGASGGSGAGDVWRALMSLEYSRQLWPRAAVRPARSLTRRPAPSRCWIHGSAFVPTSKRQSASQMISRDRCLKNEHYHR